MLNWQGINWDEGRWGEEEWKQLAQLLNAGQEFGWLGIQYPYLHRDPETGQWYEFPRDALPDAHWYERASVERAVYHEGLFTIFFGWEAGFSNKHKAWVWIRPPTEGRQPVNARDFDTLARDGYSDRPYQPSVVETSHGNLLRVGEDTISFPKYTYRVDPTVEVKSKSSRDGSVYGGFFLVPPDYRATLSPVQIRSKG